MMRSHFMACNNGGGDVFGYFVGMSGDTAVIAAVGEGSRAMGVNGNQSNNNADISGAAYVFAGLGSPPQLMIARSAQNLTLSWPVSATNYVLEAAISRPALSRDTVTNAPSFGAKEVSVQLPSTGHARFFRLRNP